MVMRYIVDKLASLLVLVATLGVGGGCFPVVIDGASASDSGSTGGGGGTTGDGGGGDGVVCPGVAYTRTDQPGTALCLDGSATFECAWGSGNPAVDGYMVQGDHDAVNDRLTLSFPDDPSNTSFTDFIFDMLYDVGGVDLVLEYMGTRTGDYREVGSWAEAVAGDQGVCGGGGGGEAGSCQQPCAADGDCGPGTACLLTDEGQRCLPSECGGCFAAESTCTVNLTTCEFDRCEPVEPDVSETCRQPCAAEGDDCSPGEYCANTTAGYLCLPSECQGCFDAGLSCSSNGATCEFNDCV